MTGGGDSVAVVVAGVDGSAASLDALRWAARQAELTGAELRVVHAWDVPAGYGFPVDYADVDFEGEARRVLDRAVEEVLGGERHLAVSARGWSGAIRRPC